MGSFSVDRCFRHWMGQPLYCSAAHAGGWGERGYGDGASHYDWLSSITLLPWCLAFVHRHFPPRSPPSHPISPPLCSQQQPSPWDCSRIPKLQLPAAVPSRGPASLSGYDEDCLILIQFRLPQIRCFTLSLKYFSSDSDSCSRMGIRHQLRFYHPPWGQVQAY